MMPDPVTGGASDTVTAMPDQSLDQRTWSPAQAASDAEDGKIAGSISVSAPLPMRLIWSESPSDGTAPPPPRFVVELERCFQKVQAGLPVETLTEFRARRHHDKGVKIVFDALPRFDEPLELALFVWMKANPSEVVAPHNLSAGLTYISRFRDKMFFSAPAIPRLEVLAAIDQGALHQFCSIMNACPDLDVDAIYRAVGRQKKVYSTYENTPLAQLLDEFNARRAMGDFEAFLLEAAGTETQKVGRVGFIKHERSSNLRADGCLDDPTFRKLQARLHFEDRPEILYILSQSSAYTSSLARFVPTYIAGYEMQTADLASRLGTILVCGK
jgi:hypothetical protein